MQSMLGLRTVLLLGITMLSTGLQIPLQTPLCQSSVFCHEVISRSHAMFRLPNLRAARHVSVRMSGEEPTKSKEEQLAELIKERNKLQNETDELMKRRQELLRQDVAKLVTTSNPSTENAKPPGTPSSTEKADSAASNTQSFDLFSKPKDDSGLSNDKKRVTRGGFLRAFAIGTVFTGITFITAIVLSYPRLERLAYIQFSSLFEQGALAFNNKLRKAIDANDFATVEELTKAQGQLEVELLQPMIFWAAGNADADQLYLAEIETVTKNTKLALDQIFTAAQSKNATAAGFAWDSAKKNLSQFVLLANQRIPADISPLSAI